MIQSPEEESVPPQDRLVEPNPRQQNKIIRYLATGDISQISPHEVTEVLGERSQVLKYLPERNFPDGRKVFDEVKRLLTSIEKPDFNSASQEILHDEQLQGLYKQFLNFSLTSRTRESQKGGINYRIPWANPLSFGFDSQAYLKQGDFSENQKKDLEKKFRIMAHTLFGKSQEYWEQVKLLLEEANQKKTPEESVESTEDSGPEAVKIDELKDEEAEKLLNLVEVHGSVPEQEYKQMLKKEGLLPKYRVKVGESFIWLSSSAYDLGQGRVAVVGFVEKFNPAPEGEYKIVARSFYRSNSQGVWRYLPDFRQTEGKGIGWYGKGYDEVSVTLPWQMQIALINISDNTQGKEIKTVTDPEQVFSGTARKLSKNGTYYQEIAATPKRLPGNFYSYKDFGLVPPEEVEFSDPAIKPDFSQVIAKRKTKSGVYGNIELEVYRSKNVDKETGDYLYYTFCKDVIGRVWLGNIEMEEEVQSTGLKKHWVKMGCLATPGVEYQGYDNGYGNYHKVSGKSGEYVDMFDNYLSKVPLIKEYQQARLKKTA